ncbi:activator of (r)-2-hydroxyglutaryl-coa dehydratase [hydrocarbon metagenome]|uniref:Activator of (R)-2-hydroxyglutaryl-coa dehydratase n=1 Tax=hydrocarbon metagenome TaxID=938273 RepID=A0A0W8E7Y8_9ZZZZ
MKITFPHMGNAHIAINAMLEKLKLEVIPPPPISKKTFELGVKYCPEFACMPLKINLGNFIEALEMGADTILMAGGWGPCRFGLYAQVERDILNDLGFEYKMIILEAPDSRVSELFNQLKALGENVSVWEAYKAVRYAWYKIKIVENLEKRFAYIHPRAMDKNRAEDIYDKGLLEIQKAGDRSEVDKVGLRYLECLNRLVLTEEEPLKIGLVGEIYTVLEPMANCSISRCLGRLNVEVDNSIYISDWLNDHLLGGLVKKSHRKHLVRCANPYLNYFVGGHGLETVGSAVDYARKRFDGVIQVGPLTCMPEIVAQSVLGLVSKEEGIPCMTLYFDEHAGTAGIQTRLEAFTDMLRRKKTLTGWSC